MAGAWQQTRARLSGWLQTRPAAGGVLQRTEREVSRLVGPIDDKERDDDIVPFSFVFVAFGVVGLPPQSVRVNCCTMCTSWLGGLQLIWTLIEFLFPERDQFFHR